jgi:hypothetical protein
MKKPADSFIPRRERRGTPRYNGPALKQIHLHQEVPLRLHFLSALVLLSSASLAAHAGTVTQTFSFVATTSAM